MLMPLPADPVERRKANSRGGKKGGPARARKLSAKRRSEIALMGALARIRKQKQERKAA